MEPVSAAAIYFIVWWISLFLILPFGVRSQVEAGDVVPGTEPGAPVRPRMLRVVIANTLVASVIFAFIYMVVVKQLIRLDDIPFLPGRDWPTG
jgi:predicted secreted protein